MSAWSLADIHPRVFHSRLRLKVSMISVHYCRRSNSRIINLLCALLRAVVWSGCGTKKNLRPDQAVKLVPAAVIKLAETDTVYVGKPISVAVSSNGEIFVTDGFAKRVHRYDATGQLLEVIGTCQ